MPVTALIAKDVFHGIDNPLPPRIRRQEYMHIKPGNLLVVIKMPMDDVLRGMAQALEELRVVHYPSPF
jgi:hypothetical protein